VNADVLGISSAQAHVVSGGAPLPTVAVQSGAERCSGRAQRWLPDSREVRNSERRIVVEVIRLYEAL